MFRVEGKSPIECHLLKMITLALNGRSRAVLAQWELMSSRASELPRLAVCLPGKATRRHGESCLPQAKRPTRRKPRRSAMQKRQKKGPFTFSHISWLRLRPRPLTGCAKGPLSRLPPATNEQRSWPRSLSGSGHGRLQSSRNQQCPQINPQDAASDDNKFPDRYGSGSH